MASVAPRSAIEMATGRSLRPKAPRIFWRGYESLHDAIDDLVTKAAIGRAALRRDGAKVESESMDR
jgi:hypothetical protein